MIEELPDSIPNNSMFGTSLNTIEIYESTVNGDDSIYQAAISINLDDGSDTDSKYTTTIFTELFHSNIMQLAKIAFLYTSTLFPNMNPEYAVYDLGGNMTGKFKFADIVMLPDNTTLQ